MNHVALESLPIISQLNLLALNNLYYKPLFVNQLKLNFMNIEDLSKQDMFEKIFKEHMKVETYSKSIESLFNLRSKSKINFAPYYQRNYVWDSHKA